MVTWQDQYACCAGLLLQQSRGAQSVLSAGVHSQAARALCSGQGPVGISHARGTLLSPKVTFFAAESLPLGYQIPCILVFDLCLTPQNSHAVQAAISTEPLHRSGVHLMRLVQAYL